MVDWSHENARAQAGPELVLLGGRVLSRQVAESDPGRWQTVLQDVYLSRETPRCLCRGRESPIPMYVERRGRTYSLKRTPGSGESHHQACPSHGGMDVSGANAVSTSAILKRSDGLLDIKLDVPLRTVQVGRGATAASAPTAATPTGAGSSRQQVKLLGLLHLLWERAGLHRWTPPAPEQRPRTLGDVYEKLRNELDDIVLGKSRASSIVYVPDTRLDDPAQRHKEALIAESYMHLQAKCPAGERPVLMVIAECRSFFDGKYSRGLRLKGFPDSMPIWIPASAMTQIEKSWNGRLEKFMSAMGGSAGEGTRLFVIAGLQFSEKGALNWLYGSLMETTGRFIPVESGFEALVANALVEEGRAFVKPLRYTGQEEVHPDFVLTDTKRPWYLEVFGMATPQYLERKRAKITHYRESGKLLWSWDAAAGTQLPPFPVG